MNDPGNIPKNGQQYIQPEGTGYSNLQKYPKWRENDCKNDFYDIHKYALVVEFELQSIVICKSDCDKRVGSIG